MKKLAMIQDPEIYDTDGDMGRENGVGVATARGIYSCLNSKIFTLFFISKSKPFLAHLSYFPAFKWELPAECWIGKHQPTNYLNTRFNEEVH